MLRNVHSNWSQKGFDALKRIAEETAEEAEQNPGEWVNPTPLESQIRCDESGFCTVYTSMNHGDQYVEQAVGDSSTAATTLLHSWINDLEFGDYDTNRSYIEDLLRMADMGI